MLVSLLSWIYIGGYCLTAGILVRGILGRFFIMEKAPERMSITGTAVYGMIGITVYAQMYSLFDGVGAICHILLLVLSAGNLILSPWARGVLRNFLKRLKGLALSWEGLFLLAAVLAVAFFTSRGTFHTDTGIYHAQAIRIIEDYGVIKGAANLQLHFGYNSSYLVFCAFFTMRWLTGTALHTTTGFLFALLGGWAFHGLLHFRSHERHGADFLRIAILIYVLTNAAGAMSPATDYGTIILALYVIAAFLEAVEHRPPRTMPSPTAEDAAWEQYLTSLGMAAMGGLFLVSMKLSAAALFLLALYPLVMFLRRREWKIVGKFVLLGVVVILPYLARNVILTGWLFYPVSAIDLFDVEWKVPVEYLENDAAQIEVWGRCLYDVDLVDLPVSEWLSIWWEEQQHYAQMLIYANILSAPLFLCDLVLVRCRRRSGGEGPRWEIVSVVFMLYAGLAMWFFTAPFVRYGLAFLLSLPLLAVGLLFENCLGAGRARESALPEETADAADPVDAGVRKRLPGLHRIGERKGHKTRRRSGGREERGALWQAGGIWLSILTALCFCSWLDNYLMDDLVFIRQNLTEPYYILQKPFDDPDMAAVEMADGVTVYYAVEGENNSYYTTPSTCYQYMLERTELIGDTIEEGFRAR